MIGKVEHYKPRNKFPPNHPFRNTIMLLPCPFCGGNAKIYQLKVPLRDLGQSWTGGEALSSVMCDECGAKSKEHQINCGPRDATDAELEQVVEMAQESWNRRK